MKDTNANWARRQIAQHGRDRYPTWSSQLRKLVEEIGEICKAANRYEALVNDGHVPAGDLLRARTEKKLRDVRLEIGDAALALYNLADKFGFDLDATIREIVRSDDRKFG